MPFVSMANLIARVRDYADQPDDGTPDEAYITDAQILDRLSKEYRRLVKRLATGGVYLGKTTEAKTPAASVSLLHFPVCILAVYQDTGSTRIRLKRVVDTVEPYFAQSSSIATYWQPQISAGGVPTVALYPTPTSGTIQVVYVPEQDNDFTSVSSDIYLSPSWEDAIVLGAALRCYAREEGSNAYLKLMYEEALKEVDLDAVQYSGGDGAVIRNSDDMYTPGDDQRMMALDPADYWYSP